MPVTHVRTHGPRQEGMARQVRRSRQETSGATADNLRSHVHEARYRPTVQTFGADVRADDHPGATLNRCRIGSAAKRGRRTSECRLASPTPSSHPTRSPDRPRSERQITEVESARSAGTHRKRTRHLESSRTAVLRSLYGIAMAVLRTPQPGCTSRTRAGISR